MTPGSLVDRLLAFQNTLSGGEAELIEEAVNALDRKTADQDAVDAAWAIANKSVDQQERIARLEEALRLAIRDFQLEGYPTHDLEALLNPEESEGKER